MEPPSDRDLLFMARNLLSRFGERIHLKSLQECDDAYFVRVYEKMLGEELPGLIVPSATHEDRVHNIQVVIDTLASDVLGMDLSHIQARGIVSGDVIQIGNLVEIFDGLLEIVLEQVDKDNKCGRSNPNESEENAADDERELDSDIIPDDHEILSDVVNEEFGIGYASVKNAASRLGDGPTTASVPDRPRARANAFHCERVSENMTVVTDGNETHSLTWSGRDADSTGELIRQAECVDKKSDRSVGLKGNSIRRFVENEKHSTSASSNHWSDILSTTDSAVAESLSVKDIGKRPRRKLGAEKRAKNGVVHVHEHTHHHFHHGTDLSGSSSSLASGTSSSSLSSRMSGGGTPRSSRRGAPKSDEVQETTLGKGISKPVSQSLPSTASSALVKDGERSIYGLNLGASTRTASVQLPPIGCAKREVPVQTNTPKMVDSSVQTLNEPYKPLSQAVAIKKQTDGAHEMRRDVANYLPRKSKVFEEVEEAAVNAVDDVSNVQNVKPDDAANTRSKQLSELNSRLKELRGQVMPFASNSAANVGLDTNAALQPEHNRKENAIDQSEEETEGEDGVERLSGEHEFIAGPLSDSELDYALPFAYRTPGRSAAARNRNCTSKGILRKPELSAVDESCADNSANRLGPSLGSRMPRSVKFDHPFLERDERLRNLKAQIDEEEKDNVGRLKNLEQAFKKQRGIMTSEKRSLPRQTNVTLTGRKLLQPGKKLGGIKQVGDVAASRLAHIYGSRRTGRKPKPSRKRSASSSPVPRRRLKTPMVLEEDEILPVMEEEFPFIYLSPHSARLMWQKQMRQVSSLCRASTLRAPTKTERLVEEAERRQAALTSILKKELDYNQRLKDRKGRVQSETSMKRQLRERRHASARARRYYDEFQVRNKARMLKRRTKEEQVFKNLFEDGLRIQKDRVRELRKFAKEERETNYQKHQDEVDSLENYYRDQFSLLAAAVAEERHDLQVRQKAQAQVLRKMRSEIRRRMEDDIRSLQDQLVRDEDVTYFRQLDADNLRREFQLASYAASRPK